MYTELVTQKIVGPEIVIAQDIVDIDICFPQLVKLADNIAVMLRNDPFIFEPEIKKITNDKKRAARLADHIKESKKPFPSHSLPISVVQRQVNIGYKINRGGHLG